MAIKLNLFPNPIFNVLTQGIGNTKITKSSAMLNAAPMYAIRIRLVHCLGKLASQIACTGVHWKATRQRKTRPWSVSQAMVVSVALRNQRWGKTRRKKTRREILVRTWATM